MVVLTPGDYVGELYPPQLSTFRLGQPFQQDETQQLSCLHMLLLCKLVKIKGRLLDIPPPIHVRAAWAGRWTGRLRRSSISFGFEGVERRDRRDVTGGPACLAGT